MEVFRRLNNISNMAWKGIVKGGYKAGVGLESFPFCLHAFSQFITRCIMNASFEKFDLHNAPDVFNNVHSDQLPAWPSRHHYTKLFVVLCHSACSVYR